MKLYTKVFLCTLAILTTSLALSGYLLVSSSYTNSLDRETDRALEGYQLLKFSLQSAMLGAAQTDSLNDETLSLLISQTTDLAPSGTTVEVVVNDAREISGELSYGLSEDGGLITASGTFSQNNTQITLKTARDVSTVYQQRSSLFSSYKMIYATVISASGIVLFFILKIITLPIIRLNRAARFISNGDYSQRAKITSGDEIGDLGESFNQMAQTIEDKISDLTLNAQQKEDFVANFAHELKTPLTSVIGYADMIYQKDLPRENIKAAAEYIVNEGLHLEALSFKLMELIVLGKQEFPFTEFSADELLGDITATLMPIVNKRGAKLEVKAHKTYVHVEYDLLKTLISNLVDNSLKAEATKIWIDGESSDNGRYVITLSDNGRGIPEEELSRITEAFYMVDKSRSRKQHSAGLGLSIASKIAELHGTALLFRSEMGKGTAVRFSLEAKEDSYEA